MTTVKLTTQGNSVGLNIPSEIRKRWNLSKGDTVHLIETATGFQVTPYDPAFEEQMIAARKIMKKRRNALRQLAK